MMRPALLVLTAAALAAAPFTDAPLHAEPPAGEPIEAAGPLAPLSGTLLRAGVRVRD